MRLRPLALALVLSVLAVLSFGAFAAGKPAGPIELRWTTDSANTNRVGLEVTGLPSTSLALLTRTNWSTEQWQELLSITIETSNLRSDLSLPPMAGRHEITNGLLRFIPALNEAR